MRTFILTTALEAEIDRRVYTLCRLTAAEVAIGRGVSI